MTIDDEEMSGAFPDPIDIHVGSRMRLRRTLLGLSQETVGSQLGLTFQQIQKYERGANRVGSSRLYKISQILQVPVSFFFDEIPEDIHHQKPADKSRSENEQLSKRETLELVRNYYKIKNEKARKKIAELIKTLEDC